MADMSIGALVQVRGYNEGKYQAREKRQAAVKRHQQRHGRGLSCVQTNYCLAYKPVKSFPSSLNKRSRGTAMLVAFPPQPMPPDPSQ